MFFSTGRNNAAGQVHQQRAGAARANVNAKEVDVGSPIAVWKEDSENRQRR